MQSKLSALPLALLIIIILVFAGGSSAEQAGGTMKTMIVIANHGTPPADFPPNERAEFSMLNARDQRGALDAKAKQRLEELSKKMRAWPRSEKNDPYFKSTRELAAALKEKMGCAVLVGYNDFCNPSIADVCNRAAEQGAKKVFVITPMMMAGGKHSEVDIPEQIRSAAQKHPAVQFIYVWPVPMQDMVEFLAGQIQKEEPYNGTPATRGCSFGRDTMKYDLIVVGGGPAGLMAAKTAAEDGLRVVLVERKKNIPEVNRACLQLLYIQKISPLEGGKTYMEPVTVDVGADASRFNFQTLGFSLDYQGSLRPYLNWIQVSPSGHQVHRFKLNDRIWGFNYDKESFLATLLHQAEKAGVEILPETAGVAAENAGDGVRISIRRERSRSLKTLEAKNAIAAEGVMSKIVQSLGLDYSRKAISTRIVKGAWYIIEGLESPFPGNSLVSFTIPSFYARNILIGMMPGNRNSITAGTLPYRQIAEHPALAPMLYKARVVKRLSFSNFVRAPLLEPIVGNIIVAGDSAAPTETWMQGAVACGYQAVKAIEKERAGGHGFREYTAWWRQAFSFINPSYFTVLSDGYALNRVCSDEEVDYVYRLLGDTIGIPAVLIDEKLERVKKDRPGLYQKLAGRTKQSMWQKQKEH